MALKYDRLDADLFSWLSRHPRGVTTASAIEALNVSCPTAKRHISRRFSQLEDRGTLHCELQGTTRICSVVGDLPATLAKQGIRLGQIEPANQRIAANDSDAFVAAGGEITRLPAAWDNPEKNAPRGSLPLGEGHYALPFFGLDSLD